MNLQYKYQNGKLIPISIDLSILVDVVDADLSFAVKIPTTNLNFLNGTIIEKINTIALTLNGQE